MTTALAYQNLELRAVDQVRPDQLAEAGDVETALALARTFARLAARRGRELIEARFWLGGSIARAESLSGRGDAFYATWSKTVGCSEAILRASVALWDVFDGSAGPAEAYERLARWVGQRLATDGGVTWRAVEPFLRHNSDRIKTARMLRRHRHELEVLEEQGADVSGVETPALKAVAPPIVDRKPAQTAPASQTRPCRVHRSSPLGRRVLEALEVLRESPQAGEITVQRVRLGGHWYQLKLTLQPE